MAADWNGRLHQTEPPAQPRCKRGREPLNKPDLWWFFFGQLPAPITKQLIEGREQDAHWTATEFLEKALSEPAPVVEDLVFNLATRDRLRTAFLREMENTPLILAPPCGIPAFKHRERSWTAGTKTIGLLDAMTQVTPWNLLGLPAAVVPFAVSAQGLPIGVQIIGRPWDEETILEVAVRLEEARGPFSAPPGFSK